MFRSRLEARWAAFADLADWPWVYEPFDGHGYLPDFIFTINGRPALVEVKPVATVGEARAHLPKIVTGIGGLWEHDVIIAGIDPQCCLYVDFIHDETDWNSSPAVITQGRRCDHLNLHPENWEMGCNLCDHDRPSLAADIRYIEHLWREAGNRTRWSAA